jgi:hypothetical protein
MVREQYESDGIPDYIARRETWLNWTDSLCKDGEITQRKYDSWMAAACCDKPKPRRKLQQSDLLDEPINDLSKAIIARIVGARHVLTPYREIRCEVLNKLRSLVSRRMRREIVKHAMRVHYHNRFTYFKVQAGRLSTPCPCPLCANECIVYPRKGTMAERTRGMVASLKGGAS